MGTEKDKWQLNMRLQWAFPTVQFEVCQPGFWRCKTVGGYCSQCRDCAASSLSASRWPGSVGHRIPMWGCSTAQDLQPSGSVPVLDPSPTRAPQLCSCQPLRQDAFQRHLWKKYPCKAEGLHYPGQSRTTSGKDKEGFSEYGTKDGLVWPE